MRTGRPLFELSGKGHSVCWLVRSIGLSVARHPLANPPERIIGRSGAWYGLASPRQVLEFPTLDRLANHAVDVALESLGLRGNGHEDRLPGEEDPDNPSSLRQCVRLCRYGSPLSDSGRGTLSAPWAGWLPSGACMPDVYGRLVLRWLPRSCQLRLRSTPCGKEHWYVCSLH